VFGCKKKLRREKEVRKIMRREKESRFNVLFGIKEIEEK